MLSLSVRPASSSEAARPPLFKILSRRGSFLSLARFPFTVCPSLPRPGLSLVIYIGGRAVMELWIPPQASLQIMWFLCGSTWFQQCRSARPAATNETLLGWLWTLAGCWQRPNKRRTSNVLPSTITSAPCPRLATGLAYNATFDAYCSCVGDAFAPTPPFF